jgi:hypothetical protein
VRASWRLRHAQVAVLKRTVYGPDADGYGGRYCYKTEAEAIAALEAWDGTADPPGQWVKHKSARGERLGPRPLVGLVTPKGARGCPVAYFRVRNLTAKMCVVLTPPPGAQLV